jgi:UDP-N-acetylglucosamine 2-epimerase (non-hydrolysing)
VTTPRILLVAGTRPEAIKLAPVADRMAAAGLLQPSLVASGQHPEMVAQALDAFGRTPDQVVALDRRTGSQSELLARLTEGLDELVAASGAAAVVVQGDTTTTLAAALVAFWRRLPVVHLEAGLRSYDLDSPFPEEANRRLVGQLAARHLAPTAPAAANLRREGVPAAAVLVTGNTVVDAVTTVAARRSPYRDPRLSAVDATATAGAERLVLVTAHRRESWGPPLDGILAAVRQLVEARPWLRVVLPAHPNPAVRAQVDAALSGVDRVLVTDPLPYSDFARLLSVAHLVLSDSGGVQEEAPSFGVPVLVLREVTERMEAVEAGCARLVGTDPDRIVKEAARLLDDSTARAEMVAAGNPFGDGRAAERAARSVAHLLGLAPAPDPLQRSVASLRPRSASAFRRVLAQPLRRRAIRTAARQQVT